MITDIKKLTVKYNGKTVGYLAQLDKGIAFQYDEKWLKNGFNISPFSLPLEDKVFINTKDIFGGLYGVFADCLPDGWGELLVVRMLARRGINYSRLSPLTKLTLISGQGLGGLTFEPNQSELDYAQTVELDRICREVNDILNDDEIKIVAETMGGVNPAFDFTMKLLKAGKSVVTSNKELVAQKGLELLKAAEENGVKWLSSDFKKGDGYLRSCTLSKEYSLYRQNFCGCVFSKGLEKDGGA